MSAPKKGKDLSALKARLAKKAAAAEGAPAPGAAPDVPAPGEVKAAVPAPGEVIKPAADIPAPGEVKKPVDIPAPGEVRKPVDIPAPGEVLQPQPEVPEEAQPRGDIANDPMSGGVAFDPSAGLIDDVGVELKGKSNVGLTIFAGVIGVLVGVGLGFMLHKTKDLNARKRAAVNKADLIVERVGEIEDNRSRIALKIGDVKDALAAGDGAKALEHLDELEPVYPPLGDLFGWQMAAMSEGAIKKLFKLAQYNEALQTEVGLLKSSVARDGEILTKRVAGPSAYVVQLNPETNRGVLVEYVASICAEIPEEPPDDFDPTKLKKCEGEEHLNATGYLVRQQIGGPTGLVRASQAFVLEPAGPIYQYAIGLNPEAYAKGLFDLSMGKIEGITAEMVKLNEEAATDIAKFSSNPPVSENE